MGRGKAGHGRAGQAFELVESGAVDRATANSSPRTPRATNRMTRPPRPSPPQEAARGFWIRAWGQRVPALQGTGRSSDPARSLGSPEGGLDDPDPSRQNHSLRIVHPIRTLTHFTRVTRRWNPELCLSCDNSLLESRSPPRDASAGRSRPWPGCCPRRRVCPIPGRVDSS